MVLSLYNTLSRKKEEFKPLDDKKVGIYVCGITAYDSCHLGHARAAISFDIITRYLRYKGYDVTYVRNFTDVDDKIIKKANEEEMSCSEISNKYIDEYRADMHKLGNKEPDIEPKATEHITDMIETISKLIENGLAYEADGEVFFSVRNFKEYGKLSGKNIDDLESGARVEVNKAKRDPLDFSLWKPSKPGEPKWTSPWGEGRPGWHIECSSMSSKYLGQPFDIHGGGRDLVFPHHENEIAQAEGAENKQFVHYWLHNGFININAEKMSKSLGNFATIKDVVATHTAEAVRFFIISNHYRSPIDYTNDAMKKATATLDRFYETDLRINLPKKKVNKAKPHNKNEEEIHESLTTVMKKVEGFMDDDFNSAGAIGAVFEVVRSMNRYLDSSPDKDSKFYHWVTNKWRKLKSQWNNIFGIFGSDSSAYFKDKNLSNNMDSSKIEDMIRERTEARVNKDFKRADEIRDQLLELGIIIKDKPDGTTEWRKK